MKLSFVIPVYNVEAYLTECVESIMHQWTTECEIILVDDGSKDGSGLLCDELACGQDRIRVIHKENGGLSSARNAGLDIAKGNYIAFVDSDDRIAEGCVAQILLWIEQHGADLCFMEAKKFYPNGKKEPMGDCIERQNVFMKSHEEVMAHIASRPKYPGSACTKLYRRKFLDENGLRFPRDRRHSEDLGFIRDCLLAADSFDVLNIPYYEYRQNREGSITYGISMKSFDDLGLFVTESIALLTKKRIPLSNVARSALSFAAYEYSVLLWHYYCFDKERRKQVLPFLMENRWILRYGISNRLQAIRLLTSICGIHISSILIGFYMNHRRREGT